MSIEAVQTAITQQLAMLTESELANCRTGEAALDDLVWSRDYLDLDWSPHGLQICFERSGQSPELCESLRLSLEGAEIVNPEHPEGVGTHWVYSKITFLTPEQVKIIAEQFAQIDVDQIVAWMPEDIAEANALFRFELVIHPRIYFIEHLQKLIVFYRSAAQQHMTVAMWWD